MGKCENCKNLHSDKPRAKYRLCSKFPRDEINYVSSSEMLGEPYYFCRDINKLGQCKYYEEEKEK